MKRFLLTFALLTCFITPSFAHVVGQEVTYAADDNVPLKGYLAFDATTEDRRPAVIVVHEWWGHNDYARKRARMLAELGYVALAVDMYGEGKTAEHPDDAGAFATAVMQNQDLARARFLAAMELLKDNPMVKKDAIAAIGYCFGGATVLNMARQGVDLRGVVSFHGSLSTSTPAEPGTVKAKVLVLHGADDAMTTAEQIDAFKEEMDKAGVDYEFISYPGATHSFTNPAADQFAEKFNLPLGYNPEADQKSWEKMKSFLSEIF